MAGFCPLASGLSGEAGLDIHFLEKELLGFEKKYGLRSEVFFAAYQSGEEPQNDAWTLEFSEWASVYKTWMQRQAEERKENCEG